jgi:glycosyltransferase involved in cell wall biosynthesis
MSRYAGIKNDKICIISDSLFDESEEYKVIEIPSDFDNIDSKDLILNASVKDGKIACKLGKKLAKDMKVAVISNWKMRCGISTYCENIAPELKKYVRNLKLFIEENEFPTGDIYKIGNDVLTKDQVSVCWSRGGSIKKLVDEINNYDPDIILINHEWGLFQNARVWLSLMTQLNQYRVVVIAHSIFPDHIDKVICEAAMPEIITHLEGGKLALEAKGVSNKIYVLPHGCYSMGDGKKLWNLYNSTHTFIAMGFGFKYKNFEDSLKATYLLKFKFPDVYFTAIFSESPYNKDGHQQYYNELMVLIKQLGLEENVGIIRGFQSDEILNAYLRINTACVLPYRSDMDNKVYGSSGQARVAFSMNIPVISSSIPHFSDLPTIKANTPEEISIELEKLFDNPAAIKKQLEIQKMFVINNSWENVAKKFIEIFENSV